MRQLTESEARLLTEARALLTSLAADADADERAAPQGFERGMVRARCEAAEDKIFDALVCLGVYLDDPQAQVVVTPDGGKLPPVLPFGERVLMDRYPLQDALEARVIETVCGIVKLYDVGEQRVVYLPREALCTAEEWEQFNDVDWPADDGWEQVKGEFEQKETSDA